MVDWLTLRKVIVYSRLADLDEEGRQETFLSIDFRAPLRKTAMNRWSAERSGMVYGGQWTGQEMLPIIKGRNVRSSKKLYYLGICPKDRCRKGQGYSDEANYMEGLRPYNLLLDYFPSSA